MLPAAEGGDMMGSLRNPGAFNNVIGFRPSTTVVMSEGDEKERLLWTSGPMGRNTRDLIQLLNTLAHKPEFQNSVRFSKPQNWLAQGFRRLFIF